MISLTGYAQTFHDLKLIKDELKDRKRFSKWYSSKFNHTLDFIQDQLNAPYPYATFQNNYPLLISQIVTVHTFHKKINRIKNLIYSVTHTYRFYKKVQQTSQALLRKQNLLEYQLRESMHFPIKTGNYLTKLTQRGIDNFQIPSGKNQTLLDKRIEKINIEACHLVLDQITDKNLKDVDIRSIDKGNVAYYSLLSMKTILNTYIDKNDVPSDHACQKFIKKLDKAIEISQQLQLLIKENKPFAKDSISYYQALLKVQDSLSVFEKTRKTLLSTQQHVSTNDVLDALTGKDVRKLCEFYEQTSLDHLEQISKDVLINHLSWEIKNIVDALPCGDYAFFSLGTREHAVIVQVTHRHPSKGFAEGEYIYEIFNTGEGVSLFHNIKDQGNEQYARPWTIGCLTKEAFTYAFFEELVKAVTSSSIEKFYELHTKHLEQEALGARFTNAGNWYRLQNRGTCTFISIEACLSFHVLPTDIQKIECVKLAITVDKQKKVIEQIKSVKQSQLASAQTTVSTKQILLHINPPSQLKQNLKILEVCQQFLKEKAKVLFLPSTNKKLYEYIESIKK